MEFVKHTVPRCIEKKSELASAKSWMESHCKHISVDENRESYVQEPASSLQIWKVIEKHCT